MIASPLGRGALGIVLLVLLVLLAMWQTGRGSPLAALGAVWDRAATPITLDMRTISVQQIVLAVGGVLLVLWIVPALQIALSRGIPPEKRFDAEQEARKTLAQILAGAFVLVTWYQTWANTQVAQDAQITNRINQAITLLGAAADEDNAVDGLAQIDLRVGGVYTLERITRDSGDDYERTLNLLSLYIRRHAPRPEELPDMVTKAAPTSCQERDRKPQPRDDVQAILYVIGRLPASLRPTYTFDSSNTDLRGACLMYGVLRQVSFHNSDLRQAVLYQARAIGTDLSRAQLDGIQLSGADLSLAVLTNATLQGAILNYASVETIMSVTTRDRSRPTVMMDGANLSHAYLQRAQLPGASLRGSTMVHADVRWATLDEADLSGSVLDNINLEEAHLKSANLQDTRLMGADLTRADLRGACLRRATLSAWLEGADLTGADLRGANFLDSSGMSWGRLEGALMDDTTQIPDDLLAARPATIVQATDQSIPACGAQAVPLP